MYYMRTPAFAPLGSVPREHRIFGARADAFVRIAAPITTGLLSVGGLVLSVRGNTHGAMVLVLTGVLLGAVGAAAQAFEEQNQAGVVR